MELSEVERRAGRASAEVANRAERKMLVYCMLIKVGAFFFPKEIDGIETQGNEKKMKKER